MVILEFQQKYLQCLRQVHWYEECLGTMKKKYKEPLKNYTREK